MFGFLNIYKPAGMTSHDVVAIMRKITGIRQIGHSGTLDPFAEGVLPICIGKATRLIEYLDDDKAYIGTIQLGSSTSTYDTEGDIINVSDKKVDIAQIEEVLKDFTGEIEQLPPIYSAIKVRGKKLYEYARAGETVEICPRKVNISKLNLLNWNSELMQSELYVECSKGTYIRSLANDIGDKLGTYGHLCKLVRVKAGRFELKDAVALDNIKTKEDVLSNLINPLDCLSYPIYSVNDNEYKLISNGNSIKTNAVDGIITLVYGEQKIVAMGVAMDNLLKPEKVFI